MPSSSSELSELTSNVSSDSEEEKPSAQKGTLDHYFKNAPKNAQPPKLKKKRPPSPPHEYVLADREEVAFLVMFRSRFSDLLPKSLQHLGPQDIENGIEGSAPSDQVERLLCALLGLVLNRKKEVEKGHYTRALEDAIHQNTAQWPLAWNGRNPLHGGKNFNSMTPEEKLVLMRALVFWSFDQSEAVKSFLKEAYKQSRHEDDLNQPLSVQPWGRDGDKRRFWLIEGREDTHFRLYRESNPSLKTVTWRSLAGSIDELREVGDKLAEDGSLASRRLRDRIFAAISRFEAGEEKRRRRDYRLARKAQFSRPEPGFSLYEGRTRGKRIKYNYSDDEGGTSDAVSTRRSNRQSGVSTPAEPAAPRFSASGRQIKSRHGGEYGESLLGHQQLAQGNDSSLMDVDDEDGEPVLRGRSRRAATANGVKGRSTRHGNSEEPGFSDESDETASSNAWAGGDDEDQADQEEESEEDDEMSEEDFEGDDANPSLVVRLRYGKSKSPQTNGHTNNKASADGASPGPIKQDVAASQAQDTKMVDAPAELPTAQQAPHPFEPKLSNNQAESKHEASSAERTETTAQATSAPPLPATFNPHAYVYQSNDQETLAKPSAGLGAEEVSEKPNPGPAAKPAPVEPNPASQQI